MTKANIHKDEVDWLVLVFKTSEDQELQNESFDKLLTFGLDKNQIDERFALLATEKDEFKAFESAWEKQKERNQIEKYTNAEKIKIFLFGPFELFKYFQSGLIDLKTENYKIKFRQRIILLVSGTLFWIVLAFAAFQYYDYKGIQEIEKADISDWERNRITKQ